MIQRQINTKISNWVLSSGDLSLKPQPKKFIKFNVLFHCTSYLKSNVEKNQMLYWPSRSRTDANNVLFFLDCRISANKRTRNSSYITTENRNSCFQFPFLETNQQMHSLFEKETDITKTENW